MIAAAQILHQHKDKVIYEKPIIKDTPTLCVARREMFFVFETVLLKEEPNFIKRWANSKNSRVTTERILQFVDVGDNVYSLSKRPLTAALYLYESDPFVYLRVKFEVSRKEASDLGELFGLPYNIEL